MVEDVTIETKIKEVENRFQALGQELASLVEKRKPIDTRIGEIQAEQLRLQGDHRALKSLLPPDPAPATPAVN